MSPTEAWVRSQAIRCGRAFVAAKRHTPKWMAALITIALLIPGPQDELVVVLILAAWAAFKPVMRRDIAQAWDIYQDASWEKKGMAA